MGKKQAKPPPVQQTKPPREQKAPPPQQRPSLMGPAIAVAGVACVIAAAAGGGVLYGEGRGGAEPPTTAIPFIEPEPLPEKWSVCELRDRLAAARRPFVLSGAVPSALRLSAERLTELAGALPMPFSVANNAYHGPFNEANHASLNLTMQEWWQVQRDASSIAALRAANLSITKPQGKPPDGLREVLLAALPRWVETAPKVTNLWMSGVGAPHFSTLHFDDDDNLYFQMMGKKTFLVLPPWQSDLLTDVMDAQHPQHWAAGLAWHWSKLAMQDRAAAVRSWYNFAPELPGLSRLHARGTPYLITLQEGDVLALPRHWWHSVMYSGAEPTVAVNLWLEDRLVVWRAWSNAIRRMLSKGAHALERPSTDPQQTQAGYARVGARALALLRQAVPALPSTALNDFHFFNKFGGRDVDYGWADPRGIAAALAPPPKEEQGQCIRWSADLQREEVIARIRSQLAAASLDAVDLGKLMDAFVDPENLTPPASMGFAPPKAAHLWEPAQALMLSYLAVDAVDNSSRTSPWTPLESWRRRSWLSLREPPFWAENGKRPEHNREHLYLLATGRKAAAEFTEQPTARSMLDLFHGCSSATTGAGGVVTSDEPCQEAYYRVVRGLRETARCEIAACLAVA